MSTVDVAKHCWHCGRDLTEKPPIYVDCLPRCGGCGSYAPGWPQRAIKTALVHPKERTVVYENPRTGKIRYPGRADVPIPQRYVEQGYVKREFESAHALESFEKQNKVINDGLWCNSGNTLAPENMKE